ncbi:MAG: DUF4864 domain-containing protein [Candidatus Rokubacteria bacterium]|nr:DUF4864 domain-containing protein [Candidatus Rokubacteria bacterium]
MLVVAVTASVGAQPGDAEIQAAAMTQTVLEQLAAFRRGDWATAYTFASAGIQARFSPEAFREMVTRGYAPIAHSVGATVLGTQIADPRHGYVEIRVHGQNGETIDALYELVEEQGAWKIDGVLTKPAERGDLARPGPAPSAPSPSAELLS